MRAAEISTNQRGIAQIGTIKVSPHGIANAQGCAVKGSEHKPCARKGGQKEPCPTQISPLKVGIRQIGTR